MDNIKEILRVLAKDLTVSQKFNYIKFNFSPRREVLNYEPVTISIVATSSCTLSCDMCPTHSPKVPRDYIHAQRNTRDMSFEMFKEIIDRFKSAMNVQIIGSGEPMLNKDFFRMVDYAASRGMKVKTFSNGTTIEENIGRILGSRLDGITISINGHDAQEFSRMTKMEAALYGKIYNATKRLVEERNNISSAVKVKLSFIIDSYNYKFIKDMVETGLKLGVDQVFFCNFLACPIDGLTAEERVLTENPKIRREIKAMMARYPESVRRKFTLPPLIDRGMRRNNCDSHFSQIRFDGNGNVSSCSMMLLNMEGNGNYRDADIWNNVFFRRMRAVFLANDAALLPEPCNSCPDNKGVPCV